MLNTIPNVPYVGSLGVAKQKKELSNVTFKAGYGDASRTITKKMQDYSAIERVNGDIIALYKEVEALVAKKNVLKDPSELNVIEKLIENKNKNLSSLQNAWRQLFYGYKERGA